MNTDLQIQLDDGRKLGYAEYGPNKGRPVFHFHGSAGSRLDHPDESILRELNIRYISIDRPGYGISDFQPNRKLLDWPDDIAKLANHLGLDKFYVLGHSAGGPYALACAYKLENRVIAGAIVSGFAPPDRHNAFEGYSFFPRFFMFAARYMRPLIYLFRKMGYSQISSGKKIKIECLPLPDKKIVDKQENHIWYENTIKEAYRQGWRGIALDDLLILNAWGFNIEDIKPHIDVWQGELDENVPLAQGKYQHKAIPNSDLHVVKGEGHLYILSHWKTILKTLVK